jgi:anti-sigma-K factor RskA
VDINDIISSGLLEMYAAGLANEEEAAQVMQWVGKYPEVADELHQIESGLSRYAQSQAVQPDASVKARIFARINEQQENTANTVAGNKPQAAVISIAPFWRNVAAACALLLIGSAAMNVWLFNKNSSNETALAQNKDLLNNYQEQARLMEDNWHIVQSKYSHPVMVEGLPVAPEAQAKVFWMKDNGDVYVDPTNLPPAPAGKQYELWAIVGGSPVNAGIILTSQKGSRYRIQKMKGFGKVDAFAVSLEAASTHPAEKPAVVMAVGKM